MRPFHLHVRTQLSADKVRAVITLCCSMQSLKVLGEKKNCVFVANQNGSSSPTSPGPFYENEEKPFILHFQSKGFINQQVKM